MTSDYGKLETDVEIKASAEKFHEFWTTRPHHLTTISSDKVTGCNLREGEWGAVGCVVHWNYIHEGKAKVITHLFEAIDNENKSITLKVLEGDLLQHYNSFKMTIQASPKAEGEGSMVHWTYEYEKVHGDVEDPHTLLQFAVEMTTDICSHLST